MNIKYTDEKIYSMEDLKELFLSVEWLSGNYPERLKKALDHCEMMDTDLAFERSEVEAVITTPVVSIKNPYAGHIKVPTVGEVIRDDENAAGEIIIG